MLFSQIRVLMFMTGLPVIHSVTTSSCYRPHVALSIMSCDGRMNSISEARDALQYRGQDTDICLTKSGVLLYYILVRYRHSLSGPLGGTDGRAQQGICGDQEFG